jgi:outer membrane protein assembly factor BamB
MNKPNPNTRGRRARHLVTLAMVASLSVGQLSGQQSAEPESYGARLSPTPVTAATVRTITGGGQLSATLDGNRLTVEGTFRGLSAPATTATIHQAPPAQPGPAIHTIEVSASPEGTLRGSVQLTADQLAALRGGSLYVQIQSERSAEGDLRGWIERVTDPARAPSDLAGRPLPTTVQNFVPVTEAMLRDPDPADWPMIRRNFQAWSYSPLDQIGRDNVRNLRLEWVWNMHEGTSQPAPIVYGGTIYLINPNNVVQALDGRTGDLIWEHAAGPEDGNRMRNIAIYNDKVIQATTDSRLLALDARTGEPVWETRVADRSRGFTNTSGPIIADGKVILGQASCQNYIDDHCFVTAHDADTGERLWEFNPIAQSGTPGGDTWGDLDDIFPRGRRDLDHGELRSGVAVDLLGHRPGEALGRRSAGTCRSTTRALHELDDRAERGYGRARLVLPARSRRGARPRRGVRARAGRPRRPAPRALARQARHPLEERPRDGRVPRLHRDGLPERLHAHRPGDGGSPTATTSSDAEIDQWTSACPSSAGGKDWHSMSYHEPTAY